MNQLALFAAITLSASVALAQSPNPPAPADNTKMNKAPANSMVKSSTADGQSNATSDVKITQQIRKSVMADKNLSTYAHNVKIVTVNGVVTLNGTVRSAEEKSQIAVKAHAVAGDNVTNDIKVAPQR
ncbi:MAG: BON domain-containing protein [Steroidobacteraceae bacterium]